MNVLQELAAEISDFGEQLEGISFSGQMHSLVTLDANHQPLYPAILWNDGRTTAQCQRIMSDFGQELLEITKNRALEGFTLPKLLWLQEEKPKIWERVAKIMLPKDYLGFWFTGRLYTEYSDASGTLLLDIEKEEWSQTVCDTFGIEMNILPELLGSLEIVGNVQSHIKKRYNFQKDVQVFAGGADNACAALGAGLTDSEVALVSIGTSGVVSSVESEVKDYAGKLHLFQHVLPQLYYSLGVTLAAGNSLSWFKKTFADDRTFEELLKDVGTVQPGSEGLFFTPYIVGERTPYFDSKIRGSFIGIDAKHTLPHFTRAVMEGITFSLKDSQEIMEQEKGQKFKRMISIGGGAKNADWMQLQADIFNVEVTGLRVEEGPGTGACMLAAMGCGWFADVEQLTQVFVQYRSQTFTPNLENEKKYQQIYQQWKKIYGATKAIQQ